MYVPAETYTFHIWQSEKLDTFGKLDTFQYTWDCVYYDVIPSVPTLNKSPLHHWERGKQRKPRGKHITRTINAFDAIKDPAGRSSAGHLNSGCVLAFMTLALFILALFISILLIDVLLFDDFFYNFDSRCSWQPFTL